MIDKLYPYVNPLTYTLIFRNTIYRMYRTGWKKSQKLLNVQDGIRPYRTEKQVKINNSYMYDYLIVKSINNGVRYLIGHFFELATLLKSVWTKMINGLLIYLIK